MELNTFKGFFWVGLCTANRNPPRKLRELANHKLTSLLHDLQQLQQMKAIAPPLHGIIIHSPCGAGAIKQEVLRTSFLEQ